VEGKKKGKNCQNHSRKSALISSSEATEPERKGPEKIRFRCRKPGYIKANCRNTLSREGCRRKNTSGGAYGQGGAHESYQRRSGRGRGAYQQGREWQQRSEGDQSHDIKYENTDSFNAEVVKEVGNSQVEMIINENRKVEWILDSRCTDHDNKQRVIL